MADKGPAVVAEDPRTAEARASSSLEVASVLALAAREMLEADEATPVAATKTLEADEVALLVATVAKEISEVIPVVAQVVASVAVPSKIGRIQDRTLPPVRVAAEAHSTQVTIAHRVGVQRRGAGAAGLALGRDRASLLVKGRSSGLFY